MTTIICDDIMGIIGENVIAIRNYKKVIDAINKASQSADDYVENQGYDREGNPLFLECAYEAWEYAYWECLK
tara:strand:+ start:104 stop:319 length:216 start_codon:yes stop_codon:yes gene_type:complete